MCFHNYLIHLYLNWIKKKKKKQNNGDKYIEGSRFQNINTYEKKTSVLVVVEWLFSISILAFKKALSIYILVFCYESLKTIKSLKREIYQTLKQVFSLLLLFVSVELSYYQSRGVWTWFFWTANSFITDRCSSDGFKKLFYCYQFNLRNAFYIDTPFFGQRL